MAPGEDALREPPHEPDAPLWRNRDYMLLWVGQALSTVGTVVSGVAFPLLTLSVTHSPLQAGIVGGLERLPFPIFALIAGALTDRWNRKTVMILGDSARALALGSVPVAIALGRLAAPQLYVVALVEGTALVLFDLARVAALPRVVPPWQLAAATAQNEAGYATAALVGPPAGGLLYQLAHALPFAADALSYGASIVSLFFIRGEFSDEAPSPLRSMRRDIAEGVLWLWRRPLIRLLAFLSAAVNIAFATAALTIIVLIRAQNGTPSAVGLVFGGAAVGGILGSILGAPVRRRLKLTHTIIGVTWAIALLWPGFAYAPNTVLLGLVAGSVFLASSLLQVAQLSYRLALIPDELQGRVNSVFRMIGYSGQPVGQAVAGLLLQWLQPRMVALVIFAFLAVVAFTVTFEIHKRNSGDLDEART